MRCIPVRYMPIRCTPLRCMPVRVIFSLILPLLAAAWKRRKSFTVARSGASTFFLRTRSRIAASSGMGSPFWRASSFASSWCQLKSHVSIHRLRGGDKAPSQDITIQRCILIPLDLVHMLIAVSKTVFVSVCTPLVAIRFGTSGQLGSSNLLFGHGGGGAEEVAEEGEGG